MHRALPITAVALLPLLRPAAAGAADRAAEVLATPGLIAFWDFATAAGGTWCSRVGPQEEKSYPVYLRRVGDPQRYTPAQWPQAEGRRALERDATGPLGHAVRFDCGHLYAEVPRETFDGGPLDLHGRRPFTMVAWVKFVGRRHLICGVWDEGGWDRYAGRRQYALFGGLFGSPSVIAHLSATGAASFPQSRAAGSQYARMRAIDGGSLANGQWAAVAMTYDPASRHVTAWLNGVAHPKTLTDPVMGDVLRPAAPLPANPFPFEWPIFSPRAFVIKYNGYSLDEGGVAEHWLHVDLDARRTTYGRHAPDAARVTGEFRVELDLLRSGQSLLPAPRTLDARPGAALDLPADVTVAAGDEVVTRLLARAADGWKPVGQAVRRRIAEGAPFTFGRALGLGHGKEDIEHGSQLLLDGVAVFGRVLGGEELRRLSFGLGGD